ncbi:MAG: 30S ribosome-binding factor RbfA [Bacteroidales bacterium]
METTRQSKVARLIQKDLSDIFQKAGKEITGGKMISVTVVRVSPDLSVARVYLSIFPPEGREEFIAHLQPFVRSIRMELGKRVRFQLRIVPELAFFIDDSLDYAERIDKLLES